MKFKKKIQSLLLTGVAGLLATGCQTYQQKIKVMTENWQQGNLPMAVNVAKKLADNSAKNKDAVIGRLEQGAVLRAAGLYADSNQAFEQAQEKIDDYAQKAKVRLAQEAGAMLSNQAELDYEGRSYDGIMLNTYKALNYLALGEPDKARPEIIRAYQRQQDAVEENKKRIEKAQEAVETNKDKATIEKAQKDPTLQSKLTGVTANLDSVKIYSDYVNPFTVYLDGLYFLANAADASDLERAHKSFERVTAFAPDNDFVKQDLATADDVINGKPLPAATYVIFETGGAPVRDQIRIDIPIIVSSVAYVGAAFPTLKLQGNYTPGLTVTTGDTNVTTALVASIDGVVARDFKNELPVVITKTIAATITKAVAAYAINQAAQQAGGDLGGALGKVFTIGYQIAVNIADERTWTTLPKEFQVARVPTPADRKIDLTAPNGMKTSVTVGDGMVNVIYVKSINAGTPLLVSQFKLNGSPIVTTAPIHVSRTVTNVESNNPPASPSAAATDNGSAPIVPQAPAVQEILVTNPPATTEIATNHQAEVNSAADTTMSASATPVAVPAAATDAPVKPAEAKVISNSKVASLCATLKSDNPGRVIQALKELRRLYCPEAVPQILPCLNHYNVNVIRDACRTLAVIGDKSIIPSIQPLLQHRRADVRRDAQAAINKLQAKS